MKGGGFYEDLPKQCPPSDATSPTKGQQFYRLAAKNPPVQADFDSHNKRGVACRPGSDPCLMCACSLFETVEQAKRFLRRRGSIIVKVVLDPKAGKIKKTFSEGHFSWWISAGFDPCAHSGIVST